MVFVYIFISVAIVGLISLVGVSALLLKKNFIERAMLYLVSFSVGALFGDTFIHIMPELAKERGLNLQIAAAILAGILLFFILEKFVYWHHCHKVEEHHHIHPVGISVLVGDGLHNFLDGVIVAGAYLVSLPIGIATTIAVILHEIPQEIGDFGVLVYAGFSKRRALLYNLLSGLISILGAILAIFAAQYIIGATSILLAVAAGGFIYIAGSDLIPALHKENGWRQSFGQFVAIVLGICIMAGLLLIE
jgi:zinc and cadmium transporter